MGAKHFTVLAGVRIGHTEFATDRTHDFVAFGRPFRIGNRTLVVCECACGAVTVKEASGVIQGDTASCGCRHRKMAALMLRTHGETDTALYRIWCGMKGRCTNTRKPEYVRYGGRGITVCARWRDSFVAFADDMGPRPSSRHSIDRIDNNGPYSPENCRWATSYTQTRNYSRNVMLTFGGVSKTVDEWAMESPVSRDAIYRRLKLGWSPHDAVFTERQKNGMARRTTVGHELAMER